MSVKNRISALEAQYIDSATFSGVYAELTSSSPIEKPCFLLRITNASAVDVFVSYDGVTDHDYIIAGSVLEINAQFNNRIPSKIAYFPQGTHVWIKGIKSVGYVTLAGYYQASV